MRIFIMLDASSRRGSLRSRPSPRATTTGHPSREAIYCYTMVIPQPSKTIDLCAVVLSDM